MSDKFVLKPAASAPKSRHSNMWKIALLAFSCASDEFLETNNTCVVECATETYQVVQSANGTFINACTESSTCPVVFYQESRQKRCLLACTSSYPVRVGAECKEACPDLLPYVSGGICSATCPQQAYAESGKLKVCKPGCSLYVQETSGYKKCVSSCTGDTMYQLDSKCVASCPQKYNEVEGRKECVSSCPNYYSIIDSKTWCNDTCKDMFIDGAECVSICPNKAFDKAARLCLKSCPSQYIVQTTGTTVQNACVAACPEEYKFAAGNECRQACSSKIYAYSQNQLSVYVCMSRCDTNYYVTASGDTLCLTTCAENQMTLVEGKNKVCDYANCTTASPFISAAGGCVTKCADATTGQFYTETLIGGRTYKLCAKSCPKYFQQDSSGNKCVLTCAGLFLNKTECVASCPLWTPQNSENVCVLACVSPRIYRTNQSPTGPTGVYHCTESCPPELPYVDFSYACIKSCASGVFAVENGAQICKQACPGLAYKDPDTNLTKCMLRCSVYGLYKEGTACVKSCPGKSYWVESSGEFNCNLDAIPSGYFSMTRGTAEKTYNVFVSACENYGMVAGQNGECRDLCAKSGKVYNQTAGCVENCTSQMFVDDGLERYCRPASACQYQVKVNATVSRCVDECPGPIQLGVYRLVELVGVYSCVSACNFRAPAPTGIKLAFLCVGSDSDGCPTDMPYRTAQEGGFYLCASGCSSSLPYIGEGNECVDSCGSAMYQQTSFGKECVKSCGTYFIMDGKYKNCSTTSSCPSETPFFAGATLGCLSQCPDGYVVENGSDYNCANVPKDSQCVVYWQKSFGTKTQNVQIYAAGTGEVVSGDQCKQKCYNINQLAIQSGALVKCVPTCQTDQFVDAAGNCVTACTSTMYTLLTIQLADKVEQYNQCVSDCALFYVQEATAKRCVGACPSEYQYVKGKECIKSSAYYRQEGDLKLSMTSCMSPYQYRVVESKEVTKCVSACDANKFPFLRDTYTCANACMFAFFIESSGLRYCQSSCPTDYIYKMTVTISTPMTQCLKTCGNYVSGNYCVASCTYYSVLKGVKTCVNSCQSPYIYAETGKNQMCVDSCIGQNMFLYDGKYCVKICLIPEFYGENGACVKLCHGKSDSIHAWKMATKDRVCTPCKGQVFTETNDAKTCLQTDMCPDSAPFREVNARGEQCLLGQTCKCTARCRTGFYVMLAKSSEPKDGFIFVCTSAMSAVNFKVNTTARQSFQVVEPCGADVTNDTNCSMKCGGFLDKGVCSNSCLSKKYIVQNGVKVCVDECTQYLDGSTGECRDTCSGSYLDEENKLCLSACTGYELSRGDQKLCVAACPIFDARKDTQKICVNTCGADEFVDGKTCSASCGSTGRYRIQAGVKQCLQTDKTCADYEEYEQSDEKGNVQCVFKCNAARPYLNGNQCVSACEGKYLVGTEFDTMHYACSDTQDDFVLDSGQDKLSITECGGFVDGDRCVAACESGFFQVSDEVQVCVSSCNGNLLTMGYGPKQCVSACPVQAPYSYNKLCVSACPASAPYEQDGGACVEFCELYSESKGHRKCLSSCEQGAVFKRHDDSGAEVCLESCPPGYEKAQASNSCVLQLKSSSRKVTYILIGGAVLIVADVVVIIFWIRTASKKKSKASKASQPQSSSASDVKKGAERSAARELFQTERLTLDDLRGTASTSAAGGVSRRPQTVQSEQKQEEAQKAPASPPRPMAAGKPAQGQALLHGRQENKQTKAAENTQKRPGTNQRIFGDVPRSSLQKVI